jgi:hypothetical protein
MVMKKPSGTGLLALPPSQPEAAPAKVEKPARPVDMDRLAAMSKPRPKKEDPEKRKEAPKVKKLAKISSKNRLLANRSKRLQAQKEKDAEKPELLAITTGQGEDSKAKRPNGRITTQARKGPNSMISTKQVASKVSPSMLPRNQTKPAPIK